MTATTTFGRVGPRPGARPRVRHGFLAAALLVVAVLRGASGDWLWAALLGLGAAAEAAVLLLERRARAVRPVRGTAAQPALPSPGAIEVSLRGHRQVQRLWTVLLAGTLGTALALVVSSPSLGMLLALAALVSLVRLRRERRTVAALRLLQDRPSEATRPGHERTTS